MVFETKKISTETLGEYLSEVRGHLDLSLADVAAQCGIKKQYVAGLEEGKFGQLPADVYVFGFLRQLARIYNADAAQLIAQYKKERDIFAQLQKDGQNFKKIAGRYLHRFVVTPRFIVVGLGLLFVAVSMGYIIFQVASINETPSLEILQPKDRQVIKQSVAAVEGVTSPGTQVNINGQNVFVDGQGHFTAQIGIGDGPKSLVFVARNKFDKSVSRTISVIGETDAGAVAGAATTTQTNAAAPGVVINLKFTGRVDISFVSDGAEPISQTFESGSSTVIAAKQNILLSTSNAGATVLEVNGKTVGLLGRLGEQLKDIPFYADNSQGQ